MKRLVISALILNLLLSTPGMAQPSYQWELHGVHVVAIGGQDMPDLATFTVDQNPPPSANCEAGNFLLWPGQGADTLTKRRSVEAVYAMLLAAKLTKNPIDVYGNNAPAAHGNCTVTIIQMR